MSTSPSASFDPALAGRPRLLTSAPHTPYAFLRVVRLERARTELQGDGPDAIRDVALRWGFQNASKFSRAYQAQFGEKPSETRGRLAN